MNQSFFKEILEQEIHSVFLTPAEFGESVTLEAKSANSRSPVSEPLSIYDETMCETTVALLCICSLRSSMA